MVGVISAVAQMGSTDLAGWVGAYVDRKKIERNVKILTALVDMHAKCGNVEQALSAFREIAQPDAYPYTALISGLATHGHAKLALQVFERMQAQAVLPDPITFVGVLTACSHAGLVDKGLEYWEAMVRDYGIERRADHYACVVDMLGRAGRIEEAFEMVQTMPMGPHPGALGALLSACKTYDNVEIAEIVANKLFELEPRNTGNYILLSNIYAGKELWEEAERVRSLMRTKLPFKKPGSTWVEDRQREHA
jgi:pentatricopeptide repeat protein